MIGSGWAGQSDAPTCHRLRLAEPNERLTGREHAVVARAGVEPATFHFSGERCYQLSYLAVALATA